jgi:hypothetical protein
MESEAPLARELPGNVGRELRRAHILGRTDAPFT